MISYIYVFIHTYIQHTYMYQYYAARASAGLPPENWYFSTCMRSEKISVIPPKKPKILSGLKGKKTKSGCKTSKNIFLDKTPYIMYGSAWLSTICINEYVKNIRLPVYTLLHPHLTLFLKIFSSKFSWYLPHNKIEYLRWKNSRVELRTQLFRFRR